MATGIKKWAFILCKFSDDDSEPHSLEHFQHIFQFNRDSAADYWYAVSNGMIDFSQSQVFDWIKMELTSAETDQNKIITGAVAAAQKAEIDLNAFDYYMIYVNGNKGGGARNSPLPKFNGTILLSDNFWDMTYLAHEMGHILGLDHSFNTSTMSCDPANDGRPGAYSNPYDIMSAKCFGGFNTMFDGAEFGDSGPSMNFPNRLALGWVKESDLAVIKQSSKNNSGGGKLCYHWKSIMKTVRMELGPLHHPEYGLPVAINVSNYFIEFRKKEGWDRKIPADCILIHEVRGDGFNYLHPNQALWYFRAGDSFSDPDRNISVSVDQISEGKALVTITYPYSKYICLPLQRSKVDEREWPVRVRENIYRVNEEILTETQKRRRIL